MGYYTINKKLVFITCEKDKAIRNIAKIDKDSMWPFSSMMEGTPESKELDDFFYNYLENEEKKDPQDFKKNWIYFDLFNEEAKSNIWDLLYDYCVYYGYSRLLDSRSFEDKMADNYNHSSYAYPIGKIFDLEYTVISRGKGWKKYFKKTKERKIRITIDINKVKQIKGTLDNFTIYMDKIIIECNNNLGISFNDKNNLLTSLGVNEYGQDTYIDFSNHHFVFLTGVTGTGKSIFHDYLYRQLCSQNSPDEIGFILIDMTRHDFEWSNKSKYVISRESKTIEAIKMLENLSLEESSDKHIFIHIEECDMFVQYHERTNNAIRELLKNRRDITIIYSTSSPSERTISPFILSLVDTKVIFKTARQTDQNYILGSTMDIPPDYCKIVAFNNQNILVKPITEKDFYEIIKWRPEQ